jgi:two-component system response regulator FixJ
MKADLALISAAGDKATVAPASRTVYVIDDDSDLCKSLHTLLASSTMADQPFSGAADFFEQLPTLPPAPILLDMRMAGMDGLQLLSALRAQGVNWPVIMMTGHGDVGTAVRAMKLGAIEFLEKPFEIEQLELSLAQAFNVLEEAQRLHRLRDDARRQCAKLSPRQIEVVKILATGAQNKVAAFRLGLSVRTVEMHRLTALAKLDMKSIAEVVPLFALAGIGLTPAE